MRFAVQEGKPYLISGGKAYPVELTGNHGVKVSAGEGEETELTGYLTYEEIAAKYAVLEMEVLSQKETVLGVTVSDLISPGTKIAGNGSVTGTFYKAQIEEYWSGNTAEQKGYFFPVKLTKSGKKLTTVKNGKVKIQDYPDDALLVIKVPGKDTTVRILVDESEITTLNFRKTVFSGNAAPKVAPVMAAAKRSRKVKTLAKE